MKSKNYIICYLPLLKAHPIFLLSNLNEIIVPSHETKLQHVVVILEGLSLAIDSPSHGTIENIGAQEYVKLEVDFDLNNPYEVTEDDI